MTKLEFIVTFLTVKSKRITKLASKGVQCIYKHAEFTEINVKFPRFNKTCRRWTARLEVWSESRRRHLFRWFKGSRRCIVVTYPKLYKLAGKTDSLVFLNCGIY